MLLIGYHASEWNVDAVRSHTISSGRLLGIKLNELHKTLPQVEASVVKEAFGFHSAITVTPGRRRTHRLPDMTARRQALWCCDLICHSQPRYWWRRVLPRRFWAVITAHAHG